MEAKHGKHGRRLQPRFVCVGGADEDVRSRTTRRQKPIIFDQICLQLLITALHGTSFSFSPFLSFLPHARARPRAPSLPPRSRARTRETCSPTRCAALRCTGAPDSARAWVWSPPLHWMFAQRTPASTGTIRSVCTSQRFGFGCLFFLSVGWINPWRVKALLDFQLGAWWHGYVWQDWKVALRQGAWAQTLKAFYNRMTVFNMKAGESPVEWEARKAPRLSRYWEREGDTGGSRDLCGGLRYGGRRERTDETTWVSEWRAVSFWIHRNRSLESLGSLQMITVISWEHLCVLHTDSTGWFFLLWRIWICGCSETFPPNLSQLIPALRVSISSITGAVLLPPFLQIWSRILLSLPFGSNIT